MSGKLTEALKRIAHADTTYHPCAVGLHVCGISADGEEPVTLANFPTRSHAEARALFTLAKAECAAQEGEPDDLIVDLCLGHHNLEEEFAMPRQMLRRLGQIAGRAALSKNEETGR